MTLLARRLSACAALSSLLLAAPAARAATYTFCDFSNVSALKRNGVAAQVGTTLRLATNANGRGGSAFVPTALPFPAGTSFHTHFRIKSSPSVTGADGIAFVLQNST